MIIAGIDEAGYGPLLGPLVVSATALEVPGEVENPAELPCLWKLLDSAVTKQSGSAARGRLLVADSKQIHHLTHGDRQLERGVMAFLRAADKSPTTLANLLEVLGDATVADQIETHPWYDLHSAVPWAGEAGDLAIAANMLRSSLQARKISLAAARTKVLPEQEFNRRVEKTQNKASVLVSMTLEHLYYLHETLGSRQLVVGIDKQGGRDNYAPLLLRSFPDARLKVLGESAAHSSYHLQEGARSTWVHFAEKGESRWLPTALASMTCKYLRETLMRQFNAWFGARIEALQPTAGYYQDGLRWLGDVSPHLAALGLRKEALVRQR